MNKLLRYITALLILMSFFSVKGQDYEDDAAIWLNIYLEKKLNDKLDIHLNHKSRLSNNISEYSMGYADVGLTYNFNKNIKLLGDYVYAKRRNMDGSYGNRHQFYLALILKKKIGRWNFSYRNMLQTQVQDIYTSYEGRVPVNYERNKLTIKYEINKRFVAYVAQELYLPFYQVKSKGLDRSRSYAGLFYNLTKKSSVEVYFLYQHELNSYNRTNRDYIYGIGYSREF